MHETSASTYEVVSVQVKEYSVRFVVAVSKWKIRGVVGSQVKLKSVLNSWSGSGWVTFS